MKYAGIWYDILEAILYSFFKTRYAHEYMNISKGNNMFLGKVFFLTEYFWIYKKVFTIFFYVIII